MPCFTIEIKKVSEFFVMIEMYFQNVFFFMIKIFFCNVLRVLIDIEMWSEQDLP